MIEKKAPKTIRVYSDEETRAEHSQNNGLLLTIVLLVFSLTYSAFILLEKFTVISFPMVSWCILPVGVYILRIVSNTYIEEHYTKTKKNYTKREKESRNIRLLTVYTYFLLVIMYERLQVYNIANQRFYILVFIFAFALTLSFKQATKEVLWKNKIIVLIIVFISLVECYSCNLLISSAYEINGIVVDKREGLHYAHNYKMQVECEYGTRWMTVQSDVYHGVQKNEEVIIRRYYNSLGIEFDKVRL